MTDKTNLSRPSGAVGPASSSGVDAFLEEAKALAPVGRDGGQGARVVFALDATMSRQPTWDLACRVQAEMFEAAAEVGGLSVQLVYFRGFGECRSSRWVASPRALTDLMTQVGCRGGHTQIGRVLGHAARENERAPVKALIYVGDAMEESLDDLAHRAGELGLRGVKTFMFHEGHDPVAANAFREIARLTGGAYVRFDAAAPRSLAGLLRAAAAYASSGLDGLRRLAGRDHDARRLLAAMAVHP